MITVLFLPEHIRDLRNNINKKIDKYRAKKTQKDHIGVKIEIRVGRITENSIVIYIYPVYRSDEQRTIFVERAYTIK